MPVVIMEGIRQCLHKPSSNSFEGSHGELKYAINCKIKRVLSE